MKEKEMSPKMLSRPLIDFPPFNKHFVNTPHVNYSINNTDCNLLFPSNKASWVYVQLKPKKSDKEYRSSTISTKILYRYCSKKKGMRNSNIYIKMLNRGKHFVNICRWFKTYISEYPMKRSDVHLLGSIITLNLNGFLFLVFNSNAINPKPRVGLQLIPQD